MSTRQAHRKQAVTPPKGRPTRSRRQMGRSGALFGSTAQWIAAFGAIAVGFVILVLVTS